MTDNPYQSPETEQGPKLAVDVGPQRRQDGKVLVVLGLLSILLGLFLAVVFVVPGILSGAMRESGENVIAFIGLVVVLPVSIGSLGVSLGLRHFQR
ncbi:MAG: hypothetical protein KDA60_19290 [Planctomycetales bacterium]|nr:hypothetical protein [Planctomycetales bacterium]